MSERKLLIGKLIQKLKSGDLRSIHLDALPGRYARLDVTELDIIDPEMSQDFLKKISGGQNFIFSVKIDASKYSLRQIEERKSIQRIIKKLNTLYYQEQDEFAEYGTLSFGWGFPLLLIKDPGNPAKTLKAPLLIWKLDIDKNTSNSNSWTIRRTDDHDVYFNEVLQTHFEQYLGEKWEDPFSILQTDSINLEAIQKICDFVSEKLNIDKVTINHQLTACGSKDQVEAAAEKQAQIIPAGVLGMYKSQKQPIIQDLLQLTQISADDTENNFPPRNNSFLTPITLDPSQETVLHVIDRHGKVIIQGPPGTGKSQSLTAVITNALLEEKKVLVVCEKRTALEVLKNNLIPFGLDGFIALVEDVYKDRNVIVQKIRQLLDDRSEYSSSFKHHQYEDLKSKYLKLRQISNTRIEALYKPIFGDDSWLEMANRHHELIKNSISFDFEPLLALQESSEYYTQYRQWKDEIVRDAELLNAIRPLFETIYLLPKEWWQQRTENDVNTFHQLHEKSVQLDQHLKESLTQLGEEFYKLNTGAKIKTGILQIFSGKQKNIAQARKTATDLYRQIVQLSQQLGWTVTALPAIESIDDLTHIQSGVAASIAYSTPVNHIIDQLSQVHRWLNYTNTISDQKRKLWEKLSLLQAEDRWIYMEEWYLRNFLEYYAQKNHLTVEGNALLAELKQTDTDTKELLGKKISDIWSSKIYTLISQSDMTTKRMLYNLRKNKQYASRNSLRAILQNDFDFFTTIFPVTMVNPVVASSILPLQKNLYDIVILDEASQLRVEDTYPVLYRAASHVISGDEHQMPPSSYFSSDVALSEDTEDMEEEKDIFLAQSNSLLEYAADAGYHPTYLDFHYRSQHPDLIAFSNAGIYQSRLVPMPPKQHYQSMHFFQTDGVYQNNTNQGEAVAVVNYLYQLAEQHADNMPGIGIGTLNIQQRDLIQDLIWEYAYQDMHKAKLLDALNKAGLFIKNLENIQGDERDIIIIGTTFGKDEKGNFRQNFGPINRQQGYQLLNVLITRAKKSIHIFTSIPENYYKNYEEEISKNGNTGKALLYAYISFVRATAEGNTSLKNSILELLKNNKENAQSKSVKIELPAFVLNTIHSNLSIPVQTQLKVGGFSLEALIQKDLSKPVYLQSEQASVHQQVHYKYMMYKDVILKNYSLVNYKIWPYQWWKNPDVEFHKLTAILDRLKTTG